MVPLQTEPKNILELTSLVVKRVADRIKAVLLKNKGWKNYDTLFLVPSDNGYDSNNVYEL